MYGCINGIYISQSCRIDGAVLRHVVLQVCKRVMHLVRKFHWTFCNCFNEIFIYGFTSKALTKHSCNMSDEAIV